MLLYDENFILIGMSSSILRLLGYPSFHSFKSLYSDISELFLYENGNYVYNHTHFIKTMIPTNKKSIRTFISGADDTILEIEMNLDTCYCKNENLYIIQINKLSSTAQNKNDSFLGKVKNTKENPLGAFNVFKQVYGNEMQNINKFSDENLDNEWFEHTAKKLSMSKEIFINELKRLANDATQKDEILFEALILGDKNQIKAVLSKIRSKAYFLDIKPLIKALYRLENSKNNEISVNFRDYKDIITKINKLVERKST